MEWTTFAALVPAGLVVLFPVAYVWYLNAGGAVSWAVGRSRRSGKACSVDNDCPPGHVCMNGRCVRTD